MHQKFERKCIACKNHFQQSEMLRIAKVGDEILIDQGHKLGGRGCYVCQNKQCFDLMMKKRLLNRAFKTNVNNGRKLVIIKESFGNAFATWALNNYNYVQECYITKKK